MSKIPLKQADATLVQGAYNAAAAGIPDTIDRPQPNDPFIRPQLPG